jgi:hypothetical protein
MRGARGEGSFGMGSESGVRSLVWHGASAAIFAEVTDREDAGCYEKKAASMKLLAKRDGGKQNEKDLQYENAENSRARAQVALPWTPVRKRIASSYILVLVFFLALTSRFASSDVCGNGNPCGEPKETKKQVKRCKGVGIPKFSGPGPYRDRTQVDQGRNGEPALRAQGGLADTCLGVKRPRGERA